MSRTTTSKPTVVPSPKRSLEWQPPYRLPLADKPGGDITPIIDLYVQNEGTIFLLHGESERGHEWMRHLAVEAWQIWGEAVPVDQHHIEPIIDRARADGLVVEA
jgi:hypothetical protein